MNVSAPVKKRKKRRAPLFVGEGLVGTPIDYPFAYDHLADREGELEEATRLRFAREASGEDAP